MLNKGMSLRMAILIDDDLDLFQEGYEGPRESVMTFVDVWIIPPDVHPICDETVTAMGILAALESDADYPVVERGTCSRLKPRLFTKRVNARD